MFIILPQVFTTKFDHLKVWCHPTLQGDITWPKLDVVAKGDFMCCILGFRVCKWPWSWSVVLLDSHFLFRGGSHIELLFNCRNGAHVWLVTEKTVRFRKSKLVCIKMRKEKMNSKFFWTHVHWRTQLFLEFSLAILYDTEHFTYSNRNDEKRWHRLWHLYVRA